MSRLRTTEKTKSALQRLVKGSDRSLERNLIKLAAAVAVQSQRGEARQRASVEGGEGIASPVTEDDATTRTFYTSVGEMSSTDGLIVIENNPLHTIDLLDANANEFNVVLDDPN